MNLRSHIFAVTKWVVLVLAYGFLAYKLATFDNYAAFAEQFRTIELWQLICLAAAVLLLPLNLLLEAHKWRLLVAKLQKISIKTAFRSLLVGHTGGFATPNRLGEYPMRASCLQKEVRLSAVAMGFVGSFVQNFIITICGLVALCFFSGNIGFSASFWLLSGASVAISFLIFFFLPDIATKILSKKPNPRFVNFWQSAAAFSHSEILKLVTITFVRYAVFSFQFFLMLHFCGVELLPMVALVAIPIVYLCVTYTPSIAISEAVVRSSYAVIIVGCYSENIVGITLAGILIWLLNTAIPMIVGSILLRKMR